jgi:DNA-binding response OmpR family regulator
MNILIVEDYTALQEAWVEGLNRRGHTAVGVSQAEDVDAKLSSFAAQLVLIDLHLPGEDGLSLSRRLRHAHPDMGIIIASARNSTLDRINGFQSGADNYMVKPIGMEELYAVVESMARRLDSPRSGAANTRARSCIELDSSTLHVRGPGGTQKLTTSEYALLSGLTMAKDRALPPDEIYQLLGRDGGKKSALEAMVYRVRRKLAEAGAGEHCIRAHRLKGYQVFCQVRIV